MIGDDNLEYKYAVITLIGNGEGKADLPGPAQGPSNTKPARIGYNSGDIYNKNVLMALSYAEAVQVAAEMARTAPTSAVIFVAKVTHATKVDPATSVALAGDGIGLENHTKRARWMVTLLPDPGTPGGQALNSDNTVGGEGPAFTFLHVPPSVSTPVIVAESRYEAEQAALTIKKKKPNWRAVVSKVEAQTLSGQKRLRLDEVGGN